MLKPVTTGQQSGATCQTCHGQKQIKTASGAKPCVACAGTGLAVGYRTK